MIRDGSFRTERGHKIAAPNGPAPGRVIQLHQGGDGGKVYIHSDEVELFVLLGKSDSIEASNAYTDPDDKGWTYRIAPGADRTEDTNGYTHLSVYATSAADIYIHEGS
jgi:hypothetical protein